MLVGVIKARTGINRNNNKFILINPFLSGFQNYINIGSAANDKLFIWPPFHVQLNALNLSQGALLRTIGATKKVPSKLVIMKTFSGWLGHLPLWVPISIRALFI